MIKFNSQALTSHFESFWSIVEGIVLDFLWNWCPRIENPWNLGTSLFSWKRCEIPWIFSHYSNFPLKFFGILWFGSVLLAIVVATKPTEKVKIHSSKFENFSLKCLDSIFSSNWDLFVLISQLLKMFCEKTTKIVKLFQKTPHFDAFFVFCRVTLWERLRWVV